MPSALASPWLMCFNSSSSFCRGDLSLAKSMERVEGVAEAEEGLRAEAEEGLRAEVEAVGVVGVVGRMPDLTTPRRTAAPLPSGVCSESRFSAELPVT